VAEPRWDAYCAVILAVGMGIVQAGPLTAAGRIIAGLALAAMVPWYIWVGRPLLPLDKPTRRGPVYLAGLLVLFTAAQSQDPNAWFLAFVLCPQCFLVTTRRRAMAFVIAFNVIAGALEAWRDPGLSGVLIGLGIIIFAVAFSHFFSLWMIRVIEQSEERSVLIERLEAAQAELAAVHHQAGMLAERHRLAGEIHDTLAQGFTSIVTLLQAAQADLNRADLDRANLDRANLDRESPAAADGARRHLDLALATARENLAEARTLVTTLSPAALEASTLGEVLHRVTETTGAQAGIPAHWAVTGIARRLPTGAEVVLLRVCQEALANVRQHASARQVCVRLRYADDAVRLTVADDGRGFAAAVTPGGYGLAGMRDRVRQVGGTFEVTSAPGAGTEICAQVPG
jgi:signal transduction histidine kinase